MSSKWNDKDFLRKYHREKQRERRGIKRHPNILDDGTLWSQSHPYGKYGSHRELLDARKDGRVGIPKEECSLCGVHFYPSQKERHLNSRRHAIAMEVVSRVHHISDTVT